MVFNSALISIFLVASAVLAGRPPKPRQSRSLSDVQPSTDAASTYSPNIAGAILTGETFNSITGNITVPHVKGQSGSAAMAYVDISCSNVTLLAGVQFEVTNEGTKYQAMYEWTPDFTMSVSNIPISAEDVIQVSIVASSATSGSVSIENLTTGKSTSQKLTGPSTLCIQSAKWLVQNTAQGPLPNFGTLNIEGKATDHSKTYTLQEASIIDIQQDNQVLTKTSIHGSTVTINHV